MSKFINTILLKPVSNIMEVKFFKPEVAYNLPYFKQNCIGTIFIDQQAVSYQLTLEITSETEF